MIEKLEKHLSALKAKHAALDQELIDENARPYPDSMKVQELKKRKLAVKQEIEEVEKKLS